MSKLSFLTVQSIIQWANDTVLLHDVSFLAGNRSLPYIRKGAAFHYFKLVDRAYELIMISERDLGSF
jgi:hypothetical protein